MRVNPAESLPDIKLLNMLKGYSGLNTAVHSIHCMNGKCLNSDALMLSEQECSGANYCLKYKKCLQDHKH